MRDRTFVTFDTKETSGRDMRSHLVAAGLLDDAYAMYDNARNWALGISESSCSLYLLNSDPRLHTLLERLRKAQITPFLRVDREYTRRELDAASWLQMRITTAGLWGGIDYDQIYDAASPWCKSCGAGARPEPPLIADLSGVGKKPMDHLVYEGHLIVSARIALSLQDAGMTGIQPQPTRTQRKDPHPLLRWLEITSSLAQRASPQACVRTDLCQACGRAGHHGSFDTPYELCYSEPLSGADDFNLTWEYWGDWRQQRSPRQTHRVGGSREVIVSQRARQQLLASRVTRLRFVPVRISD